MSDYATRRGVREHRLFKQGRPLLSRIDIELTERCDNDCVHCFICLPTGNLSAQRREMSTLEVQAVLSQAAALGALTVRFTGGEPLIRSDFADIYLFARRLGLRVKLLTNARRVTPDIAELLAGVPPRELVEVSVYGMSAGTYDGATRRVGSYEEFRRGVELLLERGVRFMVKGALLPGLSGEIAEFEEWAAALPAMDRSPGYSLFFDLRARRDDGEEFERRNETIRRIRLSPADGVAFIARDRESYLETMREFCGKFIGPPGDALFSCGAGYGACVDAYGVVQACLPLRAPETTVDLRQSDSHAQDRPGAFDAARLRYALTEAFPRLRELRATNPEYLRRCAACFLKGLCEQCPAKSWAESGTLDTPVEYLCETAHEQARDLGLLELDEVAWETADWKARVERL